jgi:hypothetical protein
MAVAIVPDVVRPIQDFLGLGDQPVGRLITAMLVAVAIGYLLIFYALTKIERNNQRLRRLIRAMSAAQLELEHSHGRLGGILVAIAAYNEAESLPAVLAQIPSGSRHAGMFSWSTTPHGTTPPGGHGEQHVVTRR